MRGQPASRVHDGKKAETQITVRKNRRPRLIRIDDIAGQREQRARAEKTGHQAVYSPMSAAKITGKADAPEDRQGDEDIPIEDMENKAIGPFPIEILKQTADKQQRK